MRTLLSILTAIGLVWCSAASVTLAQPSGRPAEDVFLEQVAHLPGRQALNEVSTPTAEPPFGHAPALFGRYASALFASRLLSQRPAFSGFAPVSFSSNLLDGNTSVVGVEGDGNTTLTVQDGSANFAVTFQRGHANTTRIQQTGYLNVNGVWTEGSGNFIQGQQQGIGNTALIDNKGSTQSVRYLQQGVGNLIVGRTENMPSLITQRGSNMRLYVD